MASTIQPTTHSIPTISRRYFNFSACGNDLRTSHPAVRRFVVDSLRYWASEMGVDGFRFDLASVFMRDDVGNLNYQDPSIISEISGDATLDGLRLIAEPWQGELGGGYVLGRAFPGLTWQQWNGKFRDDVRRFVKSDNGLVSALMTRLHGSTDLFPDDLPNAFRPHQSVNFVTCHDGLCLYDMVAYTNDGQASWNCGWEGDAGVPPASRRPAQAANQELLLPADARQRRADVRRRRRVHEHSARQRQSLQRRRRDRMAGLAPVGREPGYIQILQNHDRVPQGSSVDWSKHLSGTTTFAGTE